MVRFLKAKARGKMPADGSHENGIACSPQVLAAWLEYIGYLDGGEVSVPYFFREDAPYVHAAKRIVLSLVADWCERHYDPMRMELSGLTSLRHGVDYAEVFVDLWHWVFGFTNKRLAEAGRIFDAYSPGHKTPGCIGAVAEDPVLE